MRLTIAKLLLLACFCARHIQAQTLVVESIQDYPDLRYIQHSSRDEKVLITENGLYLLKGFDLRYFTKNHTQQTKLSDLLPKELKRKISSRHDCVYHHNPGQLTIRNGDHIFVFTETKNSFKFKSHYKLKVKYPGKSVYSVNNNIYLYGVYNEHEFSECLPSGYVKLNTSDSSQKIQVIPFDYLAITHFGPNNFIDFDTSGYLVCDPLLYKIKFYNFNNELKDSICVDSKDFTASDPIVFRTKFDAEAVAMDPGLSIPEMQEYLDRVDRVWMAHYIDKNTLFVRLTRNTLNTEGKGKQITVDNIWTKTNKGWNLSMVKDLSILSTKNEPTLTNSPYPNFFLYSTLLFKNGFVYHTFWSAEGADRSYADILLDPVGADRSKLFLKVAKYRFK